MPLSHVGADPENGVHRKLRRQIAMFRQLKAIRQQRQHKYCWLLGEVNMFFKTT